MFLHILRTQRQEKQKMLLPQAVLKPVQSEILQRSAIVKVLQLDPGGTRAGELIKMAIMECNHTAYK